MRPAAWERSEYDTVRAEEEEGEKGARSVTVARTVSQPETATQDDVARAARVPVSRM